MMHKLVTLDHFGVYFNTGGRNSQPLKYTNLQELKRQMESLVRMANDLSDTIDLYEK